MGLSKKLKRLIGMTLVETLMVVAVLAILIGVAAPNVIHQYREDRLIELDDNARAIFMAAQNSLTAMMNSGEIEQINKDTKTQTMTLPAASGVAASGQTLHYLENDSHAAKLLLPAGSIESDISNGHYVVEYIPSSGVVYGVWYWESASYSYSPASRWSEDRQERLDSRTEVGWYGGSYVDRPAIGQMPLITASIINAEELVIRFSLPEVSVPNPDPTIPTPRPLGRDDIEFYLAAGGISADTGDYVFDTTKFIKIPIGEYDLSNSNETFTGEYVIDSVDKPFCDRPEFNGTGGKFNFVPGTDLTLYLVARATDDSLGLTPQVAVLEANSLFAHVNKDPASGENTANIAYGRHLQNLSTTHSKVNDAAHGGDWLTIAHAQQVRSIDFESKWDRIKGNEVYFWSETYKNPDGSVRTFDPIDSEILSTYNGNSLPIRNLTVKKGTETEYGANDAGLFGNLGDFSPTGSPINILNVVIINPSITTSADAYAGAITGFANSMTIDNCHVYMEETAATGAYDKGNISGGTVGGLVGYSSYATIKNSSASVILQAVGNRSNIGGLVGTATDTKIEGCYAACQIQDASTAGGLCASIDGSITGSYAAGVMRYGRFATLTPSAIYGISAATTGSTISDCYSAVRHIDGGVRNGDLTIYGVTNGVAENSFYVKQSGVNYETESDSGGTNIGTPLTSAKMQNYSFNKDGKLTELVSGDPDYLAKLHPTYAVFPYRGVTETADLTAPYPYPMLGIEYTTNAAGDTVPVEPVAPTIHYGDWLWEENAGEPVYYEKYSDGTYGFYGAEANDDSEIAKETWYKDNPIKSNAALERDGLHIVEDGYGIFYSGSDEPEVTSGGTELTVEKQVGFTGIGDYEFYVLTDADTKVGTDTYYHEFEVGGKTYWFNPHFACEIWAEKPANENTPNAKKNAAGDGAPSTLTYTNTAVIIRTARQLANINRYTNGTDGASTAFAGYRYEQLMDIDYASYEGYKSTAAAAGNFTTGKDDTDLQTPAQLTKDGVYDGHNFEIRRVVLGQDDFENDFANPDKKTEIFAGLFGKVAGGTVQNVTLVNVKVVATDAKRVGALVGYLTGVNGSATTDRGTVSNCGVYVEPEAGVGIDEAYKNYSVTNTAAADGHDDFVGGLIGSTNSGANISDSFAAVKVTGARRVGGFIGNLNGGTATETTTLKDCYAGGHTVDGEYATNDPNVTATNTGTGDKFPYVGGFAGEIGNGATINGTVYSTCSVGSMCTDTREARMGQFAGRRDDSAVNNNWDYADASAKLYATGALFRYDSVNDKWKYGGANSDDLMYIELVPKADTTSTFPTSKYDDTITGYFPYASNLAVHHGDWTVKPEIKPAYYEQYQGGTFGIYGEAGYSISAAPDSVIEKDGYAIKPAGTVTGTLHYYISSFYGSSEGDIDTSTWSDKVGDYYALPFGALDLDPLFEFYYSAIYINGYPYYFNPHFAFEAVGDDIVSISAPNNRTDVITVKEAVGTVGAVTVTGKEVAIRTARQLANLERYARWLHDKVKDGKTNLLTRNFKNISDSDEKLGYTSCERGTVGLTYCLAHDINFTTYDGWGTDFTSGTKKDDALVPAMLSGGTFEGNGFTVSNVYMSQTTFNSKDDSRKDVSFEYAGLFGYLDHETVSYLTIKDATVTASGGYAGTLAARVRCAVSSNPVSNISKVYAINVTVDGKDDADCVGGLFGEVEDANIGFCGVRVEGDTATTDLNELYNTHTVSGKVAGGLAGRLEGSKVSVSASYAAVKVTGKDIAGGFVGETVGGKTGADDGTNFMISRSFAGGHTVKGYYTADSNVTATAADGVAGGFVGRAKLEGDNNYLALQGINYSTCSVSAPSGTAGLFIGKNELDDGPHLNRDDVFDNYGTGAVLGGTTNEEKYLDVTFKDSSPDRLDDARTHNYDPEFNGRAYPYKVPHSPPRIDAHYGDWPLGYSVLYYEDYSDSSGGSEKGYYGNLLEKDGYDLVNTLKHDMTSTAVNDGYAVVVRLQPDRDIEVTMGGKTEKIDKGNWKKEETLPGGTYYIYCLPYSFIDNPNAIPDGKYYTTISVDNQCFYINPFFACEAWGSVSNLAAPNGGKLGLLDASDTATKYSCVPIRTARQLANMAKLTSSETAAVSDFFSKLNYQQFFTVDYATYTGWTEFTTGKDDGNRQTPALLNAFVDDKADPKINVSGQYDGHGFEIRNLYLDKLEIGDTSYAGLFARAAREADGYVIRNTTLVNVNVDGDANYAGGLVGELLGGNIYKCGVRVDGNITAGSPGSGYVSKVDELYNTFTVSGKVAGGLIGRISYNGHGHVDASYASVKVTGEDAAGGLVGETVGGADPTVTVAANSGIVERSFSGGHTVNGRYDRTVANVTATGENGVAGGLIGRVLKDTDGNYLSITGIDFSTCSVSAPRGQVGLLIGGFGTGVTAPLTNESDRINNYYYGAGIVLGNPTRNNEASYIMNARPAGTGANKLGVPATHVYDSNLTGQAYPYMAHTNTDNTVGAFYGDWITGTTAAAYIEKYADGKYGVYSAYVDGTGSHVFLNSLSGSAVIVSDFYGVVSTSDLSATYGAALGTTEIDGETYNIYNGFGTATPTTPAAGDYYASVTVDGRTYYVNTDFACEVFDVTDAGTTPLTTEKLGKPNVATGSTITYDEKSVLIRTARQLANMAENTTATTGFNYTNVTYEQLMNIDYTKYTGDGFNTGKDGSPQKPAKLDGGHYLGHERLIENLYISDTGNTGLFGEVTNGTLSDVRLVNVKVSGTSTGTGTDSVGGLVGSITGSTVTNCGIYVETDDPAPPQDSDSNWRKFVVYTVNGTAGGLVGSATDTTFTGSFAAVKVFGSVNAGGFAGTLNGGTVENCYSGGRTVNGEYATKDIVGGGDGVNVGTNTGNAGGFAGEVTDTVFEGICYSTCSVRMQISTPTAPNTGKVGLFIAVQSGITTDGATLYATGKAFDSANSSMSEYPPANTVDESSYLKTGINIPSGSITADNTHNYDAKLNGERFPYASELTEHHGDWIEFERSGVIYWEYEGTELHYWGLQTDGTGAGADAYPEIKSTPELCRDKDGEAITRSGYAWFYTGTGMNLSRTGSSVLSGADDVATALKSALGGNVTVEAFDLATSSIATEETWTISQSGGGGNTYIFYVNPAYAEAISMVSDKLGTAAHPYGIRTPQQLVNVGSANGLNFEQTHDVVFGRGATDPAFSPLSLADGAVYDGGSYRILGLNIRILGLNITAGDAALFGSVANSTVKNTILYAPDGKGTIEGKTSAAGLVATLSGGTVSNSIVAGYGISVSGSGSVGGLVASVEGVGNNIENCEATTNITIMAEGSSSGGLVGTVETGASLRIENSYAGGNIKTKGNKVDLTLGQSKKADLITYIGGVVGRGEADPSNITYDSVYSYVNMKDVNFDPEKKGDTSDYTYVVFYGIGPMNTANMPDTETSGFWGGGVPDLNTDDRDFSIGLAEMADRKGANDAKEVYLPAGTVKNTVTITDGLENVADTYKFPYAAYVTDDSTGDHIHYGDWPEVEKYAGLFYWEHEVIRNADKPDGVDEYHFYAYGAEIVNGEFYSSEFVDSLCRDHHIGERGSIVESGYGYFVPKTDGSGTTFTFNIEGPDDGKDKNGDSVEQYYDHTFTFYNGSDYNTQYVAGKADQNNTSQSADRNNFDDVYNKLKDGLFKELKIEKLEGNYDLFLLASVHRNHDRTSESTWYLQANPATGGASLGTVRMRVFPAFGGAIYDEDYDLGEGNDDDIEGANPIVIRTAEQFANLLYNSVNGNEIKDLNNDRRNRGTLDYLALGHDIDFLYYVDKTTGDPIDYTPTHLHNRVFDGFGYRILDVNISVDDGDAALFTDGRGDSGNTEIKNIIMYSTNGATIESGNGNAAGIVINVPKGKIDNCIVSGYTIKGAKNVGGISASGASISITNCAAVNDLVGMSATAKLGGIVGSSSNEVSNCYSGGSMKLEGGAAGSSAVVAGINGTSSDNSSVTSSYTYVDFTDASLAGAVTYTIGKGANVTGCYYYSHFVSGVKNVQGTPMTVEKPEMDGAGNAAKSFRPTADTSAPNRDYHGMVDITGSTDGFPFKAVVEANGEKVHYGAWPNDPKEMLAGVMYWELEGGVYTFQAVYMNELGGRGTLDTLNRSRSVMAAGATSGYAYFYRDDVTLSGVTGGTDNDDLAAALEAEFGSGDYTVDKIDTPTGTDDAKLSLTATVDTVSKTFDVHYDTGFAGVYMGEPGSSADNAYMVRTAEHIGSMSGAASGKHFVQSRDIDAKDLTGYKPYELGSGSYDGGGYRIFDLSISSSGDSVGFFSTVDGGAVIKNVLLISRGSVAITGGKYVGGLVGGDGKSYKGEGIVTITNCVVAGYTITGEKYVGGLVGYANRKDSSNYIVITNCQAVNELDGSNSATAIGGLVGYANNTSVSNSYAGGKITGVKDNSSAYAGGIIGNSSNSPSITNSYSYVDLRTTSAKKENVGAIYGRSTTIKDCYYYSPYAPADAVGATNNGATAFNDSDAATTFDGQQKAERTFNSKGEVSTKTYPFRAVVSYGFDAVGNPSTTAAFEHYGDWPSTVNAAGLLYWEGYADGTVGIMYVGIDKDGDELKGTSHICEERHTGSGGNITEHRITASGFATFNMDATIFSAIDVTGNLTTPATPTHAINIEAALKEALGCDASATGVNFNLTYYEQGSGTADVSTDVSLLGGTASVTVHYVPAYAGVSDAEFGTETNPYLIRTLGQLSAIPENVASNKCFEQKHDIYGDNGGTSFSGISSFAGSYNGDGYIILKLNDITGGLFNSLTDGAKIENVILYSTDGKGEISGSADCAGGIAASVSGNVSIKNCAVAGYTISGAASLGGLVGKADAGSGTLSIENCAAVNDITSSDTGANLGGLVGNIADNFNVTITNSYAGGSIAGSGNVGGLYGGTNAATVKDNSYSYVDLRGSGGTVYAIGANATIASGDNVYYYSPYVGSDTKTDNQGTGMTFEQLAELTGATGKAENSAYDPSRDGNKGTSYPFPAVVTVDDEPVHFGVMPDAPVVSAVFYWEKEDIGGGSYKYNVQYVGLDYAGKLVNVDKLCTAHDGHNIEEYGFGYFGSETDFPSSDFGTELTDTDAIKTALGFDGTITAYDASGATDMKTEHTATLSGSTTETVNFRAGFAKVYDAGTAPTALEIRTYGQLNSMQYTTGLGVSFTQTHDIDASGESGYVPATLGASQSYDGNGYTIKNLAINRPSDNGGVGFFSTIDGGAVIKNVILFSDGTATITGGDYVGGLVGGTNTKYGTKASVTIMNCVVAGYTITGTANVGGLVGYANCNETSNHIEITNCQAVNDLNGNNKATAIGGLVGVAWNTSINDSYAGGKITGVNSSSSYAGGIIGNHNNKATITDCYSYVDLNDTGARNDGAISGRDDTITKCYYLKSFAEKADAKGAEGKTYDEMTTLATDKAAKSHYIAMGTSTEPAGGYPFKAVVKVNGEFVHYGWWPDSTTPGVSSVGGASAAITAEEPETVEIAEEPVEEDPAQLPEEVPVEVPAETSGDAVLPTEGEGRAQESPMGQTTRRRTRHNIK